VGLALKPREFIRFLEHNGYMFIRARGGSHHIYGNGIHSLPIPMHPGKDFDEDFIRKVLREAGLTKKELFAYLGR